MQEPAETLSATAGAVEARPATPSFSRLVAWFCRWAFASVRIAPGAVEHVRQLAKRGSVIYVMRHRSLVDYLLISYVLAKEGLPPPEFANGVSALWLRPLPRLLSGLWRRLRRQFAAPEVRAFEDRERCQKLVAAGRPVLIFMRGPAPRARLLLRRRHNVSTMRMGSDYLREIVHHLWASKQEVCLVPLALLRGRGMRRKESRLATLVYSVQEVPGEIRRLITLLWNRRDTAISVGVEVQLREFVVQHQREGEERTVRRLTRALQIFLYREERLVWGPSLLPKRQVLQRVLQDDELRALVRRLAAERQQPQSQVWRQAERYCDEMAANFHGIYFSIIEFMFNRIWPRLFQGLEYWGLNRVVEVVKQHPIVLVPCHRSHFDYLILSYVFHVNFLSPPHIAAGINLSFWPLGPLFRGAGAYFIRRSFEGNELYKMVFRKYLTFLIREGYTQEFFIEGGRSRTGKILTPKLGMLSAIVDAFTSGVRRDLYLVPVSIHYGRVVEEEEYGRELHGAEKQPESLRGLLRARRVLRQRHGTVYLTFGEPISLNAALGERKDLFQHGVGPEAQEDKKRFVQKLGFRLLREVNDISVAGATSVSATVLLGMPHRACRHEEFVRRAQALARYLRRCEVRLTSSLERNIEGDFRENLSFLESGALIQRLAGEDEGVIHVPREKRQALDFYKNNTIHFFLVPALLTEAASRQLDGEALTAEISWWLDLFRWEFALPERNDLQRELERLREHLASEGALVDGVLNVEHPFVASVIGILDNFRESYWVAAQVLLSLPEEGLPRKAILERMHKRYRTGLLLGEVGKPEGNSSVTLLNALSRFVEVGCVAEQRGKGKDPVVVRGAEFAKLGTMADRILAGVVRR
jgi:glycerol-3-phosphate O-acyltransferase